MAAAPAAATAAARGPDPLRPQRAAGLGPGAMLALLVHGVLLLALALGVSWRASEPTGASAELWAAVPELAAPTPVAPPPVPVQVAPPVPKPAPPPKAAPTPEPSRDAEIAIEKARLQKEREREKEKERELEKVKERERQVRAEAEKKKLLAQQEEQRKKQAAAAALAKAEQAEKLEKADQERLEKLRLDNLKRMQGQAGATGGPTATGTAARDAGPSASYAGRIIARVKPNIVLTETLQGSPRAEVEVRAGPDGTILGRRLVKPSGEKAWDDAVLRAIDRTEILPRDTDGRVPAVMTLIFTP